MGIFSFGKKEDDAPPRRGSRSGTRAVRTERVERRSRRTERPDTDALLLDPTLPEKQRARRRLVGAIALVVAAVIVLPMVLDSHPKPVTDDVQIDIPNRPSHQAAAANDEDASDVQAGVAHDEPPASEAAATANVAPAAPAPAPAVTAKTDAKNLQDAKKAQTAAAQKPAAQPSQDAAPARRPAANAAADGDASSPASPPGARFALQLGSFRDDATARNWATKLKAAGVPAYVEHRKQADGSTATLLRAGPFADRAAASAAIAKVREAGLTQ
ncbi:sporulation related domain protein [Burkholderia thailandensis USAMRU Malaysia |uniref:Sporulation related repeat family n=2 Tax=Burkholderia thailandensis TaxID=57975 RepID=Q2T7G6_BURTA|nr:SPOR domain-containing protein [Burkholderia thailandensis]ABC35635.1 Sporulation related repeat family [Burkholderia thailandensis E264]AHI77197.1 sporulation related domain protein [Burkholderia thailandensis 2002721723]AHI80833.1 sporulation related domain protein [Burkholderia thailandensis E444]AIC89774.1 sporulation related domain protein [Burkholderia thailandensis USAMRU Malaysia \